MKSIHREWPGTFLVLALVLSACTSVHKPSGYLSDYSQLEEGKNFKQEYRASDADFAKYTKVKVEPVELRFFENTHLEYTDEDIRHLSASLKESLEKRLAKKYQVLGMTEQPDGQTLVVHPALIYATSPERVVNGLTFWLIGFQFSKGAVAFEAKLTDGGNGKELAVVTEQRKGGGGLADIKSLLIGGFFRFIHAEGAFNQWGKNLVKLTTSETADPSDTGKTS